MVGVVPFSFVEKGFFKQSLAQIYSLEPFPSL